MFISPHYFYPTDHTWLFNGPLESDEFRTNTFARTGTLTLEGFTGSGADWLDEFKPYIDDGNTVIASPHKVWSPQSNDLILQLRKRAVSKVILCGMLANMCVESHLRDLIENGFEVAVVRDATAGPRHPTRGDGYQSALINYAFLAHAVIATEEVVSAMRVPASTTRVELGGHRTSGPANLQDVGSSEFHPSPKDTAGQVVSIVCTPRFASNTLDSQSFSMNKRWRLYVQNPGVRPV